MKPYEFNKNYVMIEIVNRWNIGKIKGKKRQRKRKRAATSMSRRLKL